MDRQITRRSVAKLAYAAPLIAASMKLSLDAADAKVSRDGTTVGCEDYLAGGRYGIRLTGQLEIYVNGVLVATAIGDQSGYAPPLPFRAGYGSRVRYVVRAVVPGQCAFTPPVIGCMDYPDEQGGAAPDRPSAEPGVCYDGWFELGI